MKKSDKKQTNFVRMMGDWDAITPFYVETIIDGPNGLAIYVSGPRKKRKSGVFSFDLYYGYRNFNESDVWKHLRDSEANNSGLFVTDRSEFINWAAKQSISEKVPAGLRHYIFTSVEDVVEVLAFDDPSFEFREKSAE